MSEINENDTLSEFLKKPAGPGAYVADTVVDAPPVLSEGDELVDLGEDLDFDGFQVVRREFFAHLREPSCTFNNLKFGINSACLTKFPNLDYAQVPVNRRKKILARALVQKGRETHPNGVVSRRKNGSQKAIICKLYYSKSCL